MKKKKENKFYHRIFLSFILICVLVFQIPTMQAQISATLKKEIRIGSLQSIFTAYGSERAWNDVYYEGMDWPADYPYQDNAVIERTWLAAQGFTDANGKYWEKYGIHYVSSYVGQSLFPVEHKQIAKFPIPTIYVDGSNITAPYVNEVDEIDPNQIPDRIVSNIVNTSMGLTMSRRIYAFSQQYHDNYFIKEYTFTNTGNVDYDDNTELTTPLSGVRVSWGIRYSVCREGAPKYDNQQSWGKYTWVSKRGEDYPAHANEHITEADPIVQWLRCGFAWSGQSERVTQYDNIGAPDITGKGRLASPQHAGNVVIHVDKSATDHSDDPNQPAALGWHAGDTYPSIGDMTEVTPMIELYEMVSGNPYRGTANGGTNRFYEDNTTSITDRVAPWTLHNDGGGTNIWICYGPFDLAHGESITIVEGQGVSGLSREMCEKIGFRWKEAHDNPSDNGPFELPDGSTTTDEDIYKNSWVYTGWDSILQTFGRAKRNYDLNYNIPQPPLPPSFIEVTSGGDRINLKWTASASETDADFGGYRIFRSVGKPDTTYEEIFACGAGTTHPQIVNTYDDTTPTRGFAYYYYIVAFNDGSNNTTGEANPTGQLHSGRFYTQTTEPAFLTREAGKSLSEIRVVPNPYNIKARNLNYPGEYDKIGFLNIPAFCKINIYTERGDLIYTVDHKDGSGDEFWNSVSSSRQIVASGVYIAYFEVTRDYPNPETGKILYKKGEKAFRKFVIIR